MEGIPNPVVQCGSWASSDNGNLLEMQNLKHHPRPPESEPAF